MCLVVQNDSINCDIYNYRTQTCWNVNKYKNKSRVMTKYKKKKKKLGTKKRTTWKN